MGKSVTLVCEKVQKSQENDVTTRSGFVICSYFREGASPGVERYVEAVPLVNRR